MIRNRLYLITSIKTCIDNRNFLSRSGRQVQKFGFYEHIAAQGERIGRRATPAWAEPTPFGLSEFPFGLSKVEALQLPTKRLLQEGLLQLIQRGEFALGAGLEVLGLFANLA